MVIKKTGQGTYSIRIFDKAEHGYTDYNKVSAATAKEIDKFSTGNTKYKSDLVHMRKLSSHFPAEAGAAAWMPFFGDNLFIC